MPLAEAALVMVGGEPAEETANTPVFSEKVRFREPTVCVQLPPPLPVKLPLP